MSGIMYGVGVGPGDPELMTLKAVRLIRECSVIAVPTEKKEDSVAYQIAVQAVPEIAEKEVLEIHMPMTKDAAVLEKNYQIGTDKMRQVLDQGKDIAFLTLGDPSVYSTCMNIKDKLDDLGYTTGIISGITSFCAAAARLNIDIARKSEQIHIIPASYQIEEALKLPGTKILMKAGRQMDKVKKQVETLDADIMMVENCGMENEKVYRSAAEIDEQAGYYSLVIVKENK